MMLALAGPREDLASGALCVSGEGFRALVEALRTLPVHLKPRASQDPVRTAVVTLLVGLAREPAAVRAAALKLVLRRVPLDVGVWAYLTFVD
jgi:hypothetical protein